MLYLNMKRLILILLVCLSFASNAQTADTTLLRNYVRCQVQTVKLEDTIASQSQEIQTLQSEIKSKNRSIYVKNKFLWIFGIVTFVLFPVALARSL